MPLPNDDPTLQVLVVRTVVIVQPVRPHGDEIPRFAGLTGRQRSHLVDFRTITVLRMRTEVTSCRRPSLLVNNTRAPWPTVSSFGLTTPLDEIVMRGAGGGGSGPEGADPPHEPRAKHKITIPGRMVSKWQRIVPRATAGLTY